MWPPSSWTETSRSSRELATAWAVLHHRLAAGRSAPVAVGFSGGGDSLALLLVARDWAAASRRRLLALTVDHRLHPDSAAWTEAAGAAAARLGVPWRALAWQGPKPATGLPAAARRARHGLLAEAAREAGARVVLLGHTADDILESELIRRDTPTHGRLQEWSPSPVWPEGRGVFALRPLLALRRDELRAWLAGQGFSWLDDPANADLRFARARARAAIEGGDRSGGAGPRAPAAAQERAKWSSESFSVGRTGEIGVHRADLDGRVLSIALVCAAGVERPPRGEALDRLLERLRSRQAFTASLAGARVEADGWTVTIAREAGERARGALAPVPLSPGRVAVFDGRFELAPEPNAPAGLIVAAIAGRARRLPRTEQAFLRSAPRAARGALPALLTAAGEVRLPWPFGGGPATARCLVGERFAAALGLVCNEDDLFRAARCT